jgi:hypothetical protein
MQIAQLGVMLVILLGIVGSQSAYANSTVTLEQFCESLPLEPQCNPTFITYLLNLDVVIGDLFRGLIEAILLPVLPYAHAQQSFSFEQPDFIFQIQTIVEDIRLGFATGADKASLIVEFAKDKQTRIDTALARGETLPLAVEERRNELINTEVKTETNSDGVRVETIFNNFNNEYNKLAELNEIRILYSQFDDCKMTCTEQDKQVFNDKVNSLDSWEKKCSGTFNIDNFDYSDSGFDKLSNSCPELKTYDRNSLLHRISGNT